MELKITKTTGLYFFLVLAIGNASLRFGSSGMSSFFRLLVPLPAIVIIINRHKELLTSLFLMLFGMVYSIVVSMIGYGIIFYEYFVFVAYIYFVFIIIFEIKNSEVNFNKNFWNFLHCITVITLVLAFIQYFVRIPYPYVNLPAKHGMNLFMSNENELGEPLGFISLIYFYKILFENKKSYTLIVAMIMIVEFINDAKLTILGCLLGYVLLVYFKFGKMIKFSAKKAILLGVIFFAIVLFGIYLINPMLKFRDYSISIKDLFFDLIGNIFALRPLQGSGGSLMDRSNAIIYGLYELINSKLLGIGLGNSVVMLSREQYKLATAKSMHNIVIQFLCEMGFFAISVYFYFVKWMLKNAYRLYREKIYILKYTFIISFIIISAQSSIGILSNYYTWIIVFFVALYDEKNCYMRNKIIQKERVLPNC